MASLDACSLFVYCGHGTGRVTRRCELCSSHLHCTVAEVPHDGGVPEPPLHHQGESLPGARREMPRACRQGRAKPGKP